MAAFVIGYGSGGFGGLLLINYIWLKLDGGAASDSSRSAAHEGCFFPRIDLFWTFPVLENRNLGLVSQTDSLQSFMESAGSG